ncbi:MAG TPA: ATP-binding cassette domain-containing protein [Chitinophagaceae bacterium]|nr:ATP-binding cassette domain-containing protein [Chitinophagaceae bacterium]
MTVKALQGVSFSVPKGSVFGILGPNGSGKTTLLGILLDVLKRDAGEYNWVGYTDPSMARKQIGSLLETPNFYHYMTATDNLKISAKIKGQSEAGIDDVLKIVNLYERRDSAFSTFSLGMKQRLAIAAALLGNPSILVLDEPTNGLDPVGISEIRSLILRLNEKGLTVIMASHLLDEVEKVCTDVAILKKGNLISSGRVTDVMSDEEWFEVNSNDREALFQCLSNCSLVRQVRKEQQLMVSLHDGFTATSLNEYCFQQGVVLNHLQQRKRSLESKFMEITK